MIITIIIHFVRANKFFRIGFFYIILVEANKFKICSHHRDQLGIYWRGRRRTCQVPPEISTHKSAKKKGDRSVLKGHSLAIKKRIEKIIPVESGKEEKQTLSKLNSSFVKFI